MDNPYKTFIQKCGCSELINIETGRSMSKTYCERHK